MNTNAQLRDARTRIFVPHTEVVKVGSAPSSRQSVGSDFRNGQPRGNRL